MKEILNQLIEYKTLEKGTAKEILINLAQGKYNQSQVASFLTVYLMRSITVEELEGFRDAMLDLCIPVEIPEYDAIDLCGTGGDGKNTFNISTLSSFIVAAAGQHVAKHGNNGVSSVSGSSNLMAHFGYQFTSDIDKIKKSLDECGLCFLHAPLFHPAMKNVAPIRRELGVKTFFNMLGPMVNPSFPKKQLVGVFSLELARLYGYLYQKTDKKFVILHALDGYDEISLTGSFKKISNGQEEIISPEQIGLSTIKAEEIFGGQTVEESAKIFENILKGEGTKPQNEVVIANAAMAIQCGKGVSTYDAIGMAKEALESGKALKTFRRILEL
ncbi:anthranilate phosphoribosyltransferase [Roseivirga pacifica]|uniref:anthranilate phosphoribosyltransferase n=1 Tax=Roseivirga pacifica TaxID=1267423 RepID=UPI002094E423|nr:anthranilate phosphoribosyltransferase [Roseivirga pacifica]MCO6357371.1 anthranilate phosphoribosyltransferase [Roseivirga pacifica]MCO6367915.1 anthranilate phosphoribosyltransferase [Roseivirga pacifica]MCO6369603.1 anthranilate phosphoribosyltransferase [Roseivirga pacifica]MCO6373457.1 anthranilate phosphoribosyltransferase [Roseivirga pacifica]MCO6377286.1 anthranilate phosphoribosyltransferase [Roseivirga pacifica]